ncbi:MAG TPA: 50S ribosome-binding GTPase, partial [Myxococcota bacterium]|nr:50S ribosome-binding GTPase [Myxococcota bacterium]
VVVADRSFVIADMPGLIEGASEGAGLGHQFLRHCERTSLLAHLVDVSSTEDPEADFRVVRNELEAHGTGLGAKRFILVASKVDVPGCEENALKLEALAEKLKVRFFAISAMSGEGVADLCRAMAEGVFQPEQETW